MEYQVKLNLTSKGEITKPRRCVHHLERRATQRTWHDEDASRTQELGHASEVVPLNGSTDVNAIKADHAFAIFRGDAKAIAMDDLWARSCRHIGSTSRVDAPRFLCAPRFQRILAVINYITVNLNTCQPGNKTYLLRGRICE